MRSHNYTCTFCDNFFTTFTTQILCLLLFLLGYYVHRLYVEAYWMYKHFKLISAGWRELKIVMAQSLISCHLPAHNNWTCHCSLSSIFLSDYCFILSFIQSMTCGTLAYTPGLYASAQPTPQEVTPSNVYRSETTVNN